MQSTEDEGRLERAVRDALELTAEPSVEALEGHFGNRILRVSYHLTGEEAALAFGSLADRLGPDTRKTILNGLQETVDEHSALYLRLDKQALVEGKVALGGGETVRVRVKPRLFLLGEGVDAFYRDALGARS